MGDRSRQGGHGVDRRGRCLLGRADGRFYNRLLGARHLGHSWQAVAAGGTTIGRQGMDLAARVLAATAWDLFQTPELLRDAKAEHRRRLAGRSYHSLLGPNQPPPLDYRLAPSERGR